MPKDNAIRQLLDNPTIVAALLRERTPVTFSALGFSMHPTIRDGESVRVRPFQPADLRPGTVLLFRHHGRLGLHRLIRQDGDTLILAGDASLRGYDQATPADVLGTADSVQRHGRAIALNTRATQLTGRIRHALRPLRRLIHSWRHHDHPASPTA